MNKQRKQRLATLVFLLVGISAAVSLVLYALRQNVNLYYTPAQVVAQQVPQQEEFRLGGMVEKGSVHYAAHSLMVSFILTDFKQQITVRYNGVLPALFREGQGIVAQGRLNPQGTFIADQVLAKHDADYHPPEIPANE